MYLALDALFINFGGFELIFYQICTIID